MSRAESPRGWWPPRWTAQLGNLFLVAGVPLDPAGGTEKLVGTAWPGTSAGLHRRPTGTGTWLLAV